MKSPAFTLWSRFAALTLVAWSTLVFVDPPSPDAAAPSAVPLVLGALGGAVLFVVLARTRPAPPSLSGASVGVTVAKLAFLALAATNEELIWRRLALGEALRAGQIAAVVVSTVAFAVAHRTRQAAHLATGATFGAAYVATGSLAAPLAAHWTYNALVAGAVDRTRRSAVAEGG